MGVRSDCELPPTCIELPLVLRCACDWREQRPGFTRLLQEFDCGMALRLHVDVVTAAIESGAQDSGRVAFCDVIRIADS